VHPRLWYWFAFKYEEPATKVHGKQEQWVSQDVNVVDQPAIIVLLHLLVRFRHVNGEHNHLHRHRLCEVISEQKQAAQVNVPGLQTSSHQGRCDDLLPPANKELYICGCTCVTP
jgi:3-deoxy-D-arabino-heptulosonate 7-phosphate (DAHP) synthase